MTTARQSLARNQDGTVLVIGVFAAAFLVGTVYLVLGAGDAIEHRALMQDAADSGAYTMAVLHSRAMNMIALLNMVKISVAATITALLAIIVAATNTIAFIQSSPARLIALGAAIPLLTAILVKNTAQHAAVRGDADAVIRAADRAQETLRTRLPELAVAQANRTVVAYGAPIQRGNATVQPLPVRRGTPLTLCAQAVPLARPIALRAFAEVEPAGAKLHALGEAEIALLPSCLSIGAAAMELEPNTALGGERLQLRYTVNGAPVTQRGQQGVDVATWRKSQPASQASAVSFAQAEYYFDGVGAAAQLQADGLFTLGWRARFRRFSAQNLAGELGQACGQGGGCSNTSDVPDLAAKVSH
ncbi:MAG TPA: hypothetical protein VK698_14210 [Kofleriaceae bacterium]|nr:hypothetical protein [Kofleriaceae bacterium]